MRLLVDATTLVALGGVGELDLLLAFDGTPVVLPAVRPEVTSEPARTNLDTFVRESGVDATDEPAAGEGEPDVPVERARETLGESGYDGDVAIVAAVMDGVDADGPDPAVVSDDRRVRTVCSGLGASVTGPVGVVVRAVEERRLSAEEGTELVREIDGRGLHMTGELRERAYELVEEAASE